MQVCSIMEGASKAEMKHWANKQKLLDEQNCKVTFTRLDICWSLNIILAETLRLLKHRKTGQILPYSNRFWSHRPDGTNKFGQSIESFIATVGGFLFYSMKAKHNTTPHSHVRGKSPGKLWKTVYSFICCFFFVVVWEIVWGHIRGDDSSKNKKNISPKNIAQKSWVKRAHTTAIWFIAPTQTHTSTQHSSWRVWVKNVGKTSDKRLSLSFFSTWVSCVLF